MRVAIVGTGYVGLVTGSCFAELGHDVTCMDNNRSKVEALRQGQIPIYEPGLETLVTRNVAAGRLHFTDELHDVVNGEVIFLALPTPPDADGAADLSYVLDVAARLGPLLKRYATVVNKSTVPVGSAEHVRDQLASGATVPFDVVSNPEFLREGFAVDDFMHPDRIVIGTRSERARRLMSALYQPLVERSPLLFMDERSAELTKYAANAFLAMKIAYINDIANLCESLGADIEAVRKAVGADGRIGSRFLAPGIGYGGSCFPKDVQALAHTSRTYGYDFALLEAVIKGNRRQRKVLVHKVLDYYGGDVHGRTFALWGLAFKPDTDDIRESPALDVMEMLTAAGAHVKAHDPQAMGNVLKRFGDNRRLTFAQDPLAAARGADALLVATEWPVFTHVDPHALKSSLARPVIFDGRNIFAPDVMRAAGFYYESIGRSTVVPNPEHPGEAVGVR